MLKTRTFFKLNIKEEIEYEKINNCRYTSIGQCLASLERQLCYNSKNKTFIDPATWGINVGGKDE